MKQRDYTTRVLTAEPEHMLTEVADVDIMERTLSEEVWLAATDAPENWREVCGEELAALQAAKEAAAKARLKEMNERDAGWNV